MSNSEVKVVVLIKVNVDSGLALVKFNDLFVRGCLVDFFVGSCADVPREAEGYSFFRVNLAHGSLVDGRQT